MSYQVEFDWPSNRDEPLIGGMYSMEQIPREGEHIDFEDGGSARVHNVVWFIGERGVNHVRVVLR